MAKLKLTLFFYLCINLPNLITEEEVTEGDEVVSKAPPLLELAQSHHIFPYWLDSCPEDLEATCGQHWSSIHKHVLKLRGINTASELDKFAWTGFNGSEDVMEAAKNGRWEMIFDAPVKSCLTDFGMDILTLFQNPRLRLEESSFVSVRLWDTSLSKIVDAILGSHALIGDQVLPQVRIWWGALMGGYLSAANKERSRADAKVNSPHENLVKLLGSDSFSIPKNFSVEKARKVVEEMTQFSSALTWVRYSTDDLELVEKQIDCCQTGAAHALAERWSRLSDGGKKREFCQTMLGWMSKIIEMKVGKELEEPEFEKEDFILYTYGVTLASMIDPNAISKMSTPKDWEMIGLQAEIADFVQRWLGREEVEDLSTVIAMAEGSDMQELKKVFLGGEGTDIGVEKWKDYSLDNLLLHLGLDDLPTAFCKHFEDQTPISISWHQLVFVAAFIEQYANASRANVEEIQHTKDLTKAPTAIQQEWGKNHAVALFDDVGVGKTVSCLATIATLQDLRVKELEVRDTRIKLPSCIKDATIFAGRSFTDGQTTFLPNSFHLIVVPPNIMSQWRSELDKFLNKSCITVIEFPSESKKWSKTMKSIRTLKADRSNTIILVSHQVLSRMFREEEKALVEKWVEGTPRLKYSLPAHTLFSLSFLSIWVDEAHEARTRKTLWKAISAIFQVGLTKVLMTATPVMESPQDVLNLGLLMRPPHMGMTVEAEVRRMSKELKRMKSKMLDNTHEAAVQLEGRKLIKDKDQQDTAVFSLEKQILLCIQKHMICYCIRRTKSSKTWEGELLNAELPPSTQIHLLHPVTAAERHVGQNDMKESVRSQKFSTKTHGKFWNDAKEKVSFYSGVKTPLPYTKEMYLSGTCSKLKHLVEFVRILVELGPEVVVPTEYHGTQDHILPIDQLGVPNIFDDYFADEVDREKIMACREKVIVYTMFNKFHPFIIDALKIIGIRAVAISSAISMKNRADVIESFKNDRSISVLIMSQVGMQGLNLTVARIMILYEPSWSAVMAHQLYGRIYRRGQARPTFMFPLLASGTIEVLLTANGLNKKELLDNFLEVPTNQDTFSLLAGKASEEELNAYLEASVLTTVVDEASPLEETAEKAKKRRGKKRVNDALGEDEVGGSQQKKGKIKRDHRQAKSPRIEKRSGRINKAMVGKLTIPASQQSGRVAGVSKSSAPSSSQSSVPPFSQPGVKATNSPPSPEKHKIAPHFQFELTPPPGNQLALHREDSANVTSMSQTTPSSRLASDPLNDDGSPEMGFQLSVESPLVTTDEFEHDNQADLQTGDSSPSTLSPMYTSMGEEQSDVGAPRAGHMYPPSELIMPPGNQAVSQAKNPSTSTSSASSPYGPMSNDDSWSHRDDMDVDSDIDDYTPSRPPKLSKK